VKPNRLTAKLAAVITMVCCGCICSFHTAIANSETAARSAIKSKIARLAFSDDKLDFDVLKRALSRGEHPTIVIDSAQARAQRSRLSKLPELRANPEDVYWDNELAPALCGIQGDVKAALVYDGKLILAGSFTVAGDRFANNIVAWDGNEWSNLSTGLDGNATSMIVFENRLVVGGSFVRAGNAVVNNIAAWDGSSWSSLDEGVDNMVYALQSYGDQLIVGGKFVNAGEVYAPGAA
jgi:hypothetical protein